MTALLDEEPGNKNHEITWYEHRGPRWRSEDTSSITSMSLRTFHSIVDILCLLRSLLFGCSRNASIGYPEVNKMHE
jgi:hypothetical protein